VLNGGRGGAEDKKGSPHIRTRRKEAGEESAGKSQREGDRKRGKYSSDLDTKLGLETITMYLKNRARTGTSGKDPNEEEIIMAQNGD